MLADSSITGDAGYRRRAPRRLTSRRDALPAPVPRLQRRQRIDRAPAGVPAGRGPDLEVQVAAVGVAAVADVADELARRDVLALGDQRLVAQVHVAVVGRHVVVVDHEVVAGAALEAGELDGPRMRGDQRRTAGREQVLALMAAAAAERRRAGAVRMRAEDREAVAGELERGRLRRPRDPGQV